MSRLLRPSSLYKSKEALVIKLSAIAVIASLLVGSVHAWASSTGGDVANVSSASPCLLSSASSGASPTVTLTPQGQVVDHTGAAYTVAASDACKIIKIGGSSGTPVLTVPQANSLPTNWGGAVYQNVGTAAVNVVAQGGSSSIFDGAGGGTSFAIPENGWAVLTAESTNNWDVLVVSPTITTAAGPTVVHSGTLAGTGCGASSSNSCTGTIAATGAGNLLAIMPAACNPAGCNTNGSSFTISSVSDGGDTCSLASGTDSGSTNARDTQWWNCPNISSGRTTITVTWSTAVGYPSVYYAEVTGAAISSAIEAGSSNYTTTSPFTCTSGATTVPNDLLLVGTYNTDFSAPSPWVTLISNTLWYQGGASEMAYGATLTGTGGTEPAPCSIEAVKP